MIQEKLGNIYDITSVVISRKHLLKYPDKFSDLIILLL